MDPFFHRLPAGVSTPPRRPAEFRPIFLHSAPNNRDRAVEDRAEFDRRSSHGIHNDPTNFLRSYPSSDLCSSFAQVIRQARERYVGPRSSSRNNSQNFPGRNKKEDLSRTSFPSVCFFVLKSTDVLESTNFPSAEILSKNSFVPQIKEP